MKNDLRTAIVAIFFALISNVALAATPPVTINASDYAASPSNSGSANLTDFNLWWADCVRYNMNPTSTPAQCVIPAGNYIIAGNLVLDLKNIAGYGIHVVGAGMAQTVLNFSSGNLQITCSTTPNCGAFYGVFENFGVQASNSTAAMQLGTSSFTDVLNNFDFRNITVVNSNHTSGSAALQVNYVVNSHFENITTNASCPTDSGTGQCLNATNGDSLQLNQSVLNVFHGAFTQGSNGIHLQTGYNYGNVFLSPDFEITFNALTISNAQSTNNTWIGGTWLFESTNSAAYVVNAAAGLANVIDNPIVPAIAANGIIPLASNPVGLNIRSNYYELASGIPSVSTSWTTNYTARRVMVTISNGDVTQVCYGPSTTVNTCLSQNNSGTGLISVPLAPNDVIKLTYTGTTPSWNWVPII